MPVPPPPRPLGDALLAPVRGLLRVLVPDEPPLELQLVGRTFLQATLVGLLAGLVGVAFLFALEAIQALLLERAAGYVPLRAAGEGEAGVAGGGLRWYVVLILPALGGLACGLLARLAPEAKGGGGDAAIRAFHHHGGHVRRRVLAIKPLASIASLGTGAAGGREGPTMLIGAALGSTVGRYLALGPRERRTLMVAGIAAGVSAVFRTPLGAALLAIEVLYRDDFESEALIPAVLASVIAYSVALLVFGSTPLFGALPRLPFRPAQLPLYLGLALVIAAGATAFEGAMRVAHAGFARLPIPAWTRPGAGGLLLGAFAVALLYTIGPAFGHGHEGLGVLGGGYGAGQLAISGAPWLPGGWRGVEVLLLLAAAKLVAASLSIGSGGSAGDFAPSIAIGGLLGGAYGGAAQLLLRDPSIQPAAFALVGMAAFYAGIGKVPLAALVIVCEVAGSYDLLVPLMLTEAIAMIALRRVSLYPSQPRTTRDSPVHRPAAGARVRDLVGGDARVAALAPRQRLDEVVAIVERAADQDVFPVVDEAGAVVGLIAGEALRGLVGGAEAGGLVIVADVMAPPLTVSLDDDLHAAARALVAADLRAAPVVDEGGRFVGLLDQHDLVGALLGPPGAEQDRGRAATHAPGAPPA